MKQFEALPRAGAPVVAFDHRGHGESVAGDVGHSIENLGGDLRTVLEGLDLRDVLLVGSLDGWRRAPGARRAPPRRRARPRPRHRAALDARTDTPRRRSRRVVRRRGSRAGSTSPSLMRRPELGTLLARIGLRTRAARQPRRAHAPDARRVRRRHGSGRDHAAARPRPHARPLQDRPPDARARRHRRLLTPPAEARRLAERIPGARLVLLERAGHMLMLERAESSTSSSSTSPARSACSLRPEAASA